jgi:small subunit ribosomal protein S3
MINKYFVKQGIKEAEIEKFIRTQFPYGDYSKTELQRTPLGVKIIIYTNKPGRIIGRGGKNINEITEMIKGKFGLENPQIDVKGIRSPNLDPRIVAKQIASALERGYNYKKIGNLSMKRVMEAGAIGVEIVISGRLGGGGGKSMQGKFATGYLKHCGQPAKDLVDYGFEEATTKPGKIGIKVRIMKEFMDISGQIRNTMKAPEEEAEKHVEEKPKESDSKEEAKKEVKAKPKKTDKKTKVVKKPVKAKKEVKKAKPVKKPANKPAKEPAKLKATKKPTTRKSSKKSATKPEKK